MENEIVVSGSEDHNAVSLVDKSTGEIKSIDQFHGISQEKFSKNQIDILTKPLVPTEIGVLPSGEIYLGQISYRTRLNEAFGPGAWGLMPLSKTKEIDGVVCRQYALYVQGRYISEAVGEQTYIPNNPRMSYATAAEAAKSNALVRCCKDLGIAYECWDKRYARKFQEEHCIQVWHKGKPTWRLSDAEPFYDETPYTGDKKPPSTTPKTETQTTAKPQDTKTTDDGTFKTVSKPQAGRFKTLAWKAGKGDTQIAAKLCSVPYLVKDAESILPKHYKELCTWAEDPRTNMPEDGSPLDEKAAWDDAQANQEEDHDVPF